MRHYAGSPVQLAKIAVKRKSGGRHQRRKMEKLAKKHPAEFAAAMRKLEDRS